jgi:putative transposase
MRKPRQLLNGALYHVVARANRQELVMRGAATKALFVRTLRRARKRYAFRLENFCVMGNHFHLMIRPGPHESLSRIMQWIMSVYAMAWNRRRGVSGHVWGERFFSRVVEGIKAFLEVFKYLDDNPVKACQVANPRDWRYGGLWRHRSGFPSPCDQPSALVELLFPEHARLALPQPGFGCDIARQGS